MTREEHIARENSKRDPADIDTATGELEAEMTRLDAEISAAYWTFSRCARSKPSAITHAKQYRRRRAVNAELMHRRRKP